MTARLTVAPPLAVADPELLSKGWPARKPPSLARHNEIISDGRTVWVNSSDGVCIGRFSKRGVDVHADAAAQMSGDPQCLDCVAGLPFDQSWTRFKRSMLDFHGVELSDKHKPHDFLFDRTFCNRCGGVFGPGNHGFSHCDQHSSPESLAARAAIGVQPGSARKQAYAALKAQASRTGPRVIKERAREYALRPRELDALGEKLSSLSPRHLVTSLTCIASNPTPYRWFGFGGEVPAINLRAAKLYARYLRAKESQRARRAA